jgi:hypothetical protein
MIAWIDCSSKDEICWRSGSGLLNAVMYRSLSSFGKLLRNLPKWILG